MDTNKEQSQIFSKGSLNELPYFTGTCWLEILSANPDVFDITIGNVTFEPGCRNYWHSHPGGQILLVTSGEGYYQEKGQAKRLIKTGDVIEIQPNISHWHGSTPDNEMVHIAIGTQASLGSAEWGEAVTDEEYLN